MDIRTPFGTYEFIIIYARDEKYHIAYILYLNGLNKFCRQYNKDFMHADV